MRRSLKHAAKTHDLTERAAALPVMALAVAGRNLAENLQPGAVVPPRSTSTTLIPVAAIVKKGMDPILEDDTADERDADNGRAQRALEVRRPCGNSPASRYEGLRQPCFVLPCGHAGISHAGPARVQKGPKSAAVGGSFSPLVERAPGPKLAANAAPAAKGGAASAVANSVRRQGAAAWSCGGHF